MGRRQRKTKNISKHIKTRNKKAQSNLRTANLKVPQSLKDINRLITNELPKQQPQSISIEQLKKYLEARNNNQGDNQQKKQKIGKLSIDDTIYLERLLKKWDNNYQKMSKDAKLNKMQWTTSQIQKKHQIYKKMLQ